ncbi:MAG TPA: hypothetical protein VMH39_16435 [Gemmatimonadaceae bacterium]|nr:hypothetical protein [Gemmatimonadaceae bacterium]
MPTSRLLNRAAIVATAAACVACGSNGAGKSDSGAASAAIKPNPVTVHAKDFMFDAPSQIPAGRTAFTLVNDGPGLHHMLVVRLDSGKTVADLQVALKKQGPPPRWMVPVGGPNGPNPGDSSNAVLDLPAGQYALLCMVDIPGGIPHFAKGMIHALAVTAATTAEASAPAADDTITLADFAFTLTKPLTAGSHTFAISNIGTQPHEVEIIRLADGKTPQDFLTWMNGSLKTPPPGSALGGMAPMVPGATTYFTATFGPGTYLLACFLPDAKDGKPHFMKGMMHTEVVQ